MFIAKKISEDNFETLAKKLQTGKFAIGLGNFAYTPLNKELTKWKGSDGKEVETSLQKLIDKLSDPWFKEEVYSRIEKEDWNRLLTDANISQDDYDIEFLKGSSIMGLADSIKKIAEDLLKEMI